MKVFVEIQPRVQVAYYALRDGDPPYISNVPVMPVATVLGPTNSPMYRSAAEFAECDGSITTYQWRGAAWAVITEWMPVCDCWMSSEGRDWA